MASSERKRAAKNITLEKEKTVVRNCAMVTLRLLPLFAEYPHKNTIPRGNAAEKKHLSLFLDTRMCLDLDELF